MTNYTLRETETQLCELVTLTQKTYKPVVLMTEETATPVAVVLNIEIFEQTQRYKRELFHLQRLYLTQWLERVEVQWDDKTLREQCVGAWQRGVKVLWDTAPEPAREFCASLILAVKHLKADRLSYEQVAALFYSLELLRDSDPDEQSQEKAHQMLIDSGIPPLLSYSDDALLQSYLEEL